MIGGGIAGRLRERSSLRLAVGGSDEDAVTSDDDESADEVRRSKHWLPLGVTVSGSWFLPW